MNAILTNENIQDAQAQVPQLLRGAKYHCDRGEVDFDRVRKLYGWLPPQLEETGRRKYIPVAEMKARYEATVGYVSTTELATTALLLGLQVRAIDRLWPSIKIPDHPETVR